MSRFALLAPARPSFSRWHDGGSKRALGRRLDAGSYLRGRELGEINVGVTAAAELLIHPGKRPPAHWARGRSRPGGSRGRARLYRLAWESPRRISELLRGS